ncbi:TRAP transporter substrate-binding protein [Intrasporangium mesophilum]
MLNTRSPEEIKPVVDRLAQLSGGKLTLDADGYWEGTDLSQETDAINAVRAGKADIAVVSARPWHDAGVTAFDALIAPFTIDSLALQQTVLSSDLPDAMLPAVEKLGLEGIGVLPGSIRFPVGITRAFTSLADFKDARIGHAPSFVEELTLLSLGADPVKFIGNGTSIKGLDGISIQVAGISQYSDSVNGVTANLPLYPRPIVIVASAQAYQKLSEQQRGWLRSAVRDSIGAATSGLRKETRDTLATLCRNSWFRVYNATPEAVDALHDVVRPLVAALRDDAGTAGYLDRIAQLRAGVTPYSDETPSCNGNAGSVGAQAARPARSAFDGTYRMDLPAGCDRAPENCGTFFFVFDRGRFAFTEENGPACTWAYGTFTVSGIRFEWLFTDGGGIAPSDTLNQPGEFFAYFWKRYKEQVTLTLLTPPDGWAPAPWRRISPTPDASYLSKRCPPPEPGAPLTGNPRCVVAGRAWMGEHRTCIRCAYVRTDRVR